MAATLKLEIVTPAATVYSEDVHLVTLPAGDGQIGIFPRHLPLLTRVVPGEIIVRKNGATDFLAIGEGLVDVLRRHRHIRDDGNAVTHYFDEPLSDGQEVRRSNG